MVNDDQGLGTGKATPERQRVFAMTDGFCWYCGVRITIANMDIDHIVPSHKGGISEWGNYVPSCHPCNCSKGSMLVEEFRLMVRRTRLSDWAKHGIHFSAGQHRYLETIGAPLPEPPPHTFWFEEQGL